jgi:hypothetical protein
LTAKPFTHVPPVIENELDAAPVFLETAGAAVNVNGPAAVPAAVLLTVIVPLWLVAVPVTNDGIGAEIVTVAAVTRKLIVGEPFGVTTVTVLRPLLAPAGAVGSIVNVAVTVVSLTAWKFDTLTPAPDTVTEVAPVRPLPPSVTFTLEPRAPEAGEIVVSVGPVTVNGTVPLARPLALVTLTLCGPNPAPVVITKVAVI